MFLDGLYSLLSSGGNKESSFIIPDGLGYLGDQTFGILNHDFVTKLTVCLLKQPELRDAVRNKNLEKTKLHCKYKTKEGPYISLALLNLMGL